MAADLVLFASPVYRGSFTGALKNLLDLVPVEGLAGKACGIVMMGGSDHHYLAADTHLRPVLAWFGAHVAPVSVYLTSRHFGSDGALASPEAQAEIKELVGSVVALGRAPVAKLPGPRPLAARAVPRPASPGSHS